MNKKTILSTLGVIILGAMGSGLWELTKPFLAGAWIGLLTIATLGLDSLRDGIYAEAVAMTFRPGRSVVLLQATACLLVLLTGFQIYVFTAPVQSSLRQDIHKISWQFLLLVATVMLVLATRTSYSEGLSSYYTRLEMQAAAYSDATEIQRLRAQYARIASREQFVAHIQRLQELIKSAGGAAAPRDFF